ncbi:MAG: FAD-linked oxidase C-terminal domain-containing protein [Gammaproteobacteria bacterium]|jgi:D-lactate dehydrogenase
MATTDSDNRAGLPDSLLSRLAEAVPADRLRTAPADCWPYSYDNSKRQSLPGAVVFVEQHEEVVATVAACFEAGVPVLARGLASATTGAAVPPAGGVVIAMERMNRILRIDSDNRVAVVQPGVTNAALQDAAAAQGFFWPPDPTSARHCTVGGNLACNAAGPRAVKYGTPRDNTLGLRTVTGRGDTLRTGVYTTKGVVGYDFTRLIIGSEGTLAVVTEATLRLTPRPEAITTLRATYSDMRQAAAAVSRIMAQPVTPCALEFIDGTAIEMIRDYAETDLPEDAGAMLLIEVDGPAGLIEHATRAVGGAARGEGLVDLQTANNAEEVKALWAARRALSPALRKVAPKKVNEDVVVPVSRMAELIEGLEALSREHGITIVNFGHAGNGNIHVNLLTDPDDSSQQAALEPCLRKVFGLVLKLGGTLSGEHGIGLAKQPYIGMELEPVAIDLMRRVKAQFDPANILNPGKLFPPDQPA